MISVKNKTSLLQSNQHVFLSLFDILILSTNRLLMFLWLYRCVLNLWRFRAQHITHVITLQYETLRSKAGVKQTIIESLLFRLKMMKVWWGWWLLHHLWIISMMDTCTDVLRRICRNIRCVSMWRSADECKFRACRVLERCDQTHLCVCESLLSCWMRITNTRH